MIIALDSIAQGCIECDVPVSFISTTKEPLQERLVEQSVGVGSVGLRNRL